MFKNVPNVKRKYGKNASESFAERYQLRHYLIKFFIFNFEQVS